MALVLHGSGITSANIADGTIVNADINSSAAIDGSKLTGVSQTTSVANTAGQNWAGVTYTDPDAVGASPTAKIYPDGTVVGSTANGSYTKYPNGALECNYIGTTTYTTSTLNNKFYYAEAGTYVFPVEFLTFPSISTATFHGGDMTFCLVNDNSLIATGVALRVSGNSATATAKVQYTAIGKWK